MCSTKNSRDRINAMFLNNIRRGLYEKWTAILGDTRKISANYPENLLSHDKFLSLQIAIRFSPVTPVIFHEWKWNCRGAFHGESATFGRFPCFHRVRASRATGSDNSAKPLQLAVQSTQLANPLAFNPVVWFDARFRTALETLETRLKLIRSLLNIASNCEWRGQEIDGFSRRTKRPLRDIEVRGILLNRSG